MRDEAVELVCRARPPSVNNRSGKARDAFRRAVAAEWSVLGQVTRTDLLYGLVVWFVQDYRSATDPDADNISKAVWDTLAGDLGAFADDKQVRSRTAIIIDLAAMPYAELTGLPDMAIQALDDAIEDSAGRPHVTYIRFGALKPSTMGAALAVR